MPCEFDGKKYKEASIHQKEWGTKVINDLPFRGDEKVLDLGCGDGVLTSQIASLLPRGYVLGIDASQGMIRTAQEHKVDNLEFQQMDIDAMSFVDAFDVVFSNAALHWVKDHKRLWQNVYMALRPDGIVHFNFAGEGNCANFFQVVKEVMDFPEYKGSFRDFAWPWFMPKVHEYEKLIKEFQFREIKVWEENADRCFASATPMINWIDQPSIVPFLTYVEDTKRQEFRDLVVEKMLKNTSRQDGTYFETFRRVNVLAKK